MLTKLRVKNFKAWRDSGDIRLAPLTVLFGRNSAGKSSLGQLLLMLRQTVESVDLNSAITLGDSKSHVNLGKYSDVLHLHDLTQELGFGLEWLNENPGQANRIRFDASLRGDDRQVAVSRFKFDLGEGKSVGVSDQDDIYHLDIEGFDDPGGVPWEPTRSNPLSFCSFPTEFWSAFGYVRFLPGLTKGLERVLREIHHVGPLREPPERVYSWSGASVGHVGPQGISTIQAILSAARRSRSIGGIEYTDFQDAIKAQLRRIGLAYEFALREIGTEGVYFEVPVVASESGAEVNITEVGFGLSQVLPVVVECFCAPPDSIVLFEQPELHLHPAAQADLADVFIDAVQSLENGAPRGVQFIIESHSEHFLTRLQRRIAEEKIPADDVAMYFVDTEEGEAKLCDLGLDEFGNVQNWPEDFFGNNMDDLMGRTNAQYRRLAGGSK